MAYPRFQLARAHRQARRTTGNITVTSGTWTDLDPTGTAPARDLDLPLEAQVGDVIDIYCAGRWEAHGSAYAALDAASVDAAGSPVNYASTATSTPAGDAVIPWFGYPAAITFSGSIMFVVAAGDIVSGRVRLRLRMRATSGSGKILNASTSIPLVWNAKNLGPSDPE